MSHRLEFTPVGSNITGVLNDVDAINNINISSFSSLRQSEVNDFINLADHADHMSLLDDDMIISAPEASDLPMPDNLFDNDGEKQDDVMDVWAKLLNDNNSPNNEVKSEIEFEMEKYGLSSDVYSKSSVEHRELHNHSNKGGINQPVKIVDNQGFDPNKSNIIHPIPLRMPPEDIMKQFPQLVHPQMNMCQMQTQQGYLPMPPQTEEQRATAMLLNDLFKGSNGIPPNMLCSPGYPPPPLGMPLNGMMQLPVYQQPIMINNSNRQDYMDLPGGTCFTNETSIISSFISNNAKTKTESVISEDSFTRKQNKQSNFPSKRTIHDFALDPFAGLMSQKEREWLIKIQMVQSTISGDPNEDDYYYVNWKKRHIVQQRPKYLKKLEKLKPSYYSFDNITPSTGYTAPSFEGALGKINSASSTGPKQHISLSSQHLDNESVFSEKPTKKIKTILMTIENCYSSILIIDQNSRIIHEGKEGQEKIDQLINDNIDRIKNIKKTLYEGDFVTKCMLINKARQFLSHFLTYLKNPSDVAQFINTLLDGYIKYHKRVKDIFIIPTFVPKIKLALFSIHESMLSGLLTQLKMDFVKTHVSSEFLTLFKFDLLNRLCAAQDLMMVKCLASSHFSWLFNLEHYSKLPQIQNTSKYISYVDIDNIRRGFSNGLFGSQNSGLFENSIFSKVQYN
uniref:PAT1 domain-containing protein n=1 Tax=Parastrongyloides trichosuri TaxID=131310 RepID=A0A0N4ZSU2_PARTI